MQDFAQAYRGYSDDELASLYRQLDSLTDIARSALLAEIEARNLSQQRLNELCREQAEHTARFDRESREYRQAEGSRLLKRMALRSLSAIVLAIVAYLIYLLKFGR
jgi:hypothetical protein